MLRFRPLSPIGIRGEITDLLAVGRLIDDAMQPGQFFAAAELRLTWIAARAETIPWEIFRGHLLDRTQTREQQSFLSWHVLQNGADEPTISVKLDVSSRQIHVTRGLLCHVWEACDGSGGIESREAIRWTRELVGTIALDQYADLESVRDELICLLWQAVVGTSRLPLTSVEAPLPAFVFGQLHYLYQSGAGERTCTSWEDWLRRGLRTPCAWRETVKLTEFVLRHMPADIVEIRRLLDIFAAEWLPFSLVRYERLARALFNDVSLSPLTHFVENAHGLGVIWGGLSFLSDLLRKLCRHLTAYDLVTFHHRGANYPDALLLDGVLEHFIVGAPLFGGDDPKSRLRRRALRQACLMRRHYEGHLVPDAPTSPGENARVMPASHPRVPEEQLTQTHRRRRQLFADEQLAGLLAADARAVLAQSVRDLEHLDERVEMGLGLFIDRPLGYGKEIGAPDLTPLLAHEAFSPSLARQRWRELKKLCGELAIPCDAAVLDALFENGPWPPGLPHGELADCPRPTAALADVRKVADDFVILRTLPGALAELMKQFDWGDLTRRFRLKFLAEATPRLCVPARDGAGQPVLVLFDADLRRRLELRVEHRQGYCQRAGVEWPRAGLQVLTVWEDLDDRPELLRHENVGMVLVPRNA
jgi:hypothetical protein